MPRAFATKAGGNGGARGISRDFISQDQPYGQARYSRFIINTTLPLPLLTVADSIAIW